MKFFVFLLLFFSEPVRNPQNSFPLLLLRDRAWIRCQWWWIRTGIAKKNDPVMMFVKNLWGLMNFRSFCVEFQFWKTVRVWMFLRFLSFLSLLWILIQLNWRENIGICLWGVFCWMVIMWRFAQWPAFYRLPCVLLTTEKMTCGLWTASVALDLKWANLQYYVKFGLNCNFM